MARRVHLTGIPEMSDIIKLYKGENPIKIRLESKQLYHFYIDTIESDVGVVTGFLYKVFEKDIDTSERSCALIVIPKEREKKPTLQLDY